MKKAYTKPMVEKVAFSFDHQVVAASIPPGNYWDTYDNGGCAYNYDNTNCQSAPTPVMSVAIGKCDFSPYSLRK